MDAVDCTDTQIDLIQLFAILNPRTLIYLLTLLLTQKIKV